MSRPFRCSLLLLFAAAGLAQADPCGMVPPIYTGPGQPITRIGLQETYVFYKDGVETFIIRPGYEGKVDEFGMLIPFPKPPALRKVPDHIFPHLAAAVDPPEIVVYANQIFLDQLANNFNADLSQVPQQAAQGLEYETVRVVKQEAVGMYEVAVLEAGSPAALKKWMTKHGYKYPDGMDEVCDEYVKERWCFVAVKTKVQQKAGADPAPGQREVNVKLPEGANFDGHVQAMGFRFETEELVVPMRLSAFNDGDLRNIVYLLTDGPRKINSIPEEYVVRQISGDQLHQNVTGPLPVRIIGGTEADIPEHRRKSLPQERNPIPHNGAARDVFASDLLAVDAGKLTLEHEEREKELLAIGEALGLRGADIDKLHEVALTEARDKAVAGALADLKGMTLTLVDGDFPREVLARKNLQFAEFKMPARRNKAANYDAKQKAPSPQQGGVLKLGALTYPDDAQPGGVVEPEQRVEKSIASAAPWLAVFGLAFLGLAWWSGRSRPPAGTCGSYRRRGRAQSATGPVGPTGPTLLLVAAVLAFTPAAQADPCGMVPPIYTGPGQPITRIGLQETYVFYKDGVETFVIRPGYEGKVDEFGMLIPFPKPPALRKIPDHIFGHLAAAVDPPEVIVYAQNFFDDQNGGGDPFGAQFDAPTNEAAPALKYDTVRVVKQEAVGMYEVAVLEAGSPAALKKWMTKHGYKYPDGMDEVCDEYVKDRWCFVAVKTKVGQKAGADPEPGQRAVNVKLPEGANFDGHVQAMGFRFDTDELVVPMRLSAFNDGDLRNIVYLLTDGPRKISSIPEEYVVRQLSGEQLHQNLTGLLPVRIIGGTEADIPDWRRKSLPQERNPIPHNGAARDVFASDLLAVGSGKLTLAHEEKEKELLAIGERLGLRGAEVDKMHETALTEARNKAVVGALADLKDMTLTMVDGDFPREVLARKNLHFAEFKMPARRNKAANYDAKQKAPGPQQQGMLKLGALTYPDDVQPSGVVEPEKRVEESIANAAPWLAVVGLSFLGLAWWSGRSRPPAGTCGSYRRRGRAQSATGPVGPTGPTLLLVAAVLAFTPAAQADPCGMVPPIYTGPGQPIERVGDQITYVFYKDGVETFVIKPGFTGKVDEFGMLIPFPEPPALRKAPDNIFSQVANAIDPPEVVVNLIPLPQAAAAPANFGGGNNRFANGFAFDDPTAVKVLKKEAVGMYEIAVLAAGSAKALQRWMDEHGYQYPKGMDAVCEDYIKQRWCFVAVKTKVGQKGGSNPEPGQRKVNTKLPTGSAFDGHVQAMGFRFRTDQLVVPMRLSAFNEGELRNIVYLLSDKPYRVRAIPEEYVVRQVSGRQLHENVTGPLPLRIIGGTEAGLTDWHHKNLKSQRDPAPKNGAARDLFAGDLLAVSTGELSLQHEEKEKELLAIGERLGLRGKEIDARHEASLAEMRKKTVAAGLNDLKEMTLTVIDGDFPREVLGKHNLAFAEYNMPARRNKQTAYDANNKGPRAIPHGVIVRGELQAREEEPEAVPRTPAPPEATPSFGWLWQLPGAVFGVVLILAGLFQWRRGFVGPRRDG